MFWPLCFATLITLAHTPASADAKRPVDLNREATHWAEILGIKPSQWPALKTALLARHPRGNSRHIYHNLAHSLNVAEDAYISAIGRGRDTEDARFAAQVALIHDIDHDRAPVTSPRVRYTLTLLSAEQDHPGEMLGNEALALQRLFNWQSPQFKVAAAMIARTLYPLEHDNDIALYHDRLAQVDATHRQFAFEEAVALAAIDKSSWYVRSRTAARQAQQGLRREIIKVSGRVAANQIKSLSAFMADIFDEQSFAADRDIAAKLTLDWNAAKKPLASPAALYGSHPLGQQRAQNFDDIYNAAQTWGHPIGQRPTPSLQQYRLWTTRKLRPRPPQQHHKPYPPPPRRR